MFSPRSGFDNLVSWLQPGGLELIQKVAHSLHDARRWAVVASLRSSRPNHELTATTVPLRVVVEMRARGSWRDASARGANAVAHVEPYPLTSLSLTAGPRMVRPRAGKWTATRACDTPAPTVAASPAVTVVTEPSTSRSMAPSSTTYTSSLSRFRCDTPSLNGSPRANEAPGSGRSRSRRREGVGPAMTVSRASSDTLRSDIPAVCHPQRCCADHRAPGVPHGSKPRQRWSRAFRFRRMGGRRAGRA